VTWFAKEETVKIGLVSCGKAKRVGTHAARDLYTSTLFKESLKWAEARCDVVYVISDKHALLPLDQQVEEYEVDMGSFTKEERDDWSRRVRADLRLKAPVEVFILAGDLYVDVLKLNRMPGVTIHTPLVGKKTGQRVQWLQRENG
jgi:hypothetical protein